MRDKADRHQRSYYMLISLLHHPNILKHSCISIGISIKATYNSVGVSIKAYCLRPLAFLLSVNVRIPNREETEGNWSPFPFFVLPL